MIGQVQKLVRVLNLREHPEGGFFSESYRSPESIIKEALPERFDAQRSVSTAIYFLLHGHQFSAFHRLRQDEVWHFYEGDPLLLHRLNPHTSDYDILELGPVNDAGQKPQIVMPAGSYFAAHVKGFRGYTLCGCTVAPGFNFDDFEMPERAELIELFPERAAIIRRLTRS